ncbi:MAG: cell division protein FtsW, partial [Abditibacteriota bacterium]|nr:cell division protein FtsW [Abditibacteriota bacterium]
ERSDSRGTQTRNRYDRVPSPTRTSRTPSRDVSRRPASGRAMPSRIDSHVPRSCAPYARAEGEHDNVVDLQAARLEREERLRRAEASPRYRSEEKSVPSMESHYTERSGRAVEDDETVPAKPRKPRGLFGSIRQSAAAPGQSSSLVAPSAPCHWGLVVLALVLSLLSVPLIYSASTAIALDHHGRTDFFLVRQIGFVLAGLVVLLGASLVSQKHLRALVWILYGISLVGLVLTDFTPLGLTLGGVQRWMKIGPIQLQFSELAKIALIGVMADFWSRSARIAPRSIWPWIGTAFIALPLVGLVFLQPHLSAASLLFILPFCVAFFAGAAWQTMARIVAPLALLAVIVVVLCKTHSMPGLKTYQQDRIAAHFGAKGEDERGSNYQALQGQRALVRGGLFGAGPGGSLYKQGHLPAPHTDFIAAIIGEEWGLAGMLALLLMYGLMIFFCFHTGHSASCPFEAVLCAGIGMLISIQLVGNLGVVTGFLPVTGMPLPLLSYGGSGLLCVLLGLGLVLSVSRRYGAEAGAESSQKPTMQSEDDELSPHRMSGESRVPHPHSNHGRSNRDRFGTPSKAYSRA